MRKGIPSWYRTFARLGFVRRKLRKGERRKQKRTLQIETMEPRVFLTAATTTTITSLTGTLAYGQFVTVAAQVSEVSPNTGTPAGVVDFFDGTTNLGSGTLDGSGCTSLTTSSLTAGTHSITAAYEGDTDDADSSSTPIDPYVDQATPTVTISVPASAICNQSVMLSASVSAPASGMSTPSGTVYFYDGESELGSASLDSMGDASISTSLSTGYITASYASDGNYTSNTSSGSQYIDVEPASTSTSLSSSQSSAICGQSITLTASVSSWYGTPSGSVDFYDKTTSTDLGSASLTSGSASVSMSNLGIGNHSIVATYAGDGTFASSYSSSLSQDVELATTTTVTSSSPNPSICGQSITLTAGVSSWYGTPSGSVDFYDQTTSTDLGSAPLNSGSASLSTSNLGIGNQTIVATYGSDGTFATSNGSVSQDVELAATTTIASSSQNPSICGQSILLTASVSSWYGTPSGSVDFYDWTTNTDLGSVGLICGSASLSTSTLGAGNQSITATYGGDGTFAGSSSSISQDVELATTTTVASSSPNPSTYGQPITLTANVNSSDGTPTGSVDFYDSTTNTDLGSVSLNSGSASLPVSSLPVGGNSITATYRGDAKFAGSSASISQTVEMVTTTTIASASPNPSTYGEPITLTATVSAASQGVGTPTGTVAFYEGTMELGWASLDGWGNASLTTSLPGAGQYSLTAVYGGDAGFAGSTAAISQVVGQATSAMMINGSTGCSVYGQPVTFTATVSAASQGTGTPTGQVTFCDQATNTPLGPAATLDGSGNARLTTSGLGVGWHTILASYGGDTDFTGSDSTASVDVQMATTTTITSSSPNPSVCTEPVTLTATVSVDSPGSGIPTGTVEFYDGTFCLGSATLPEGSDSASLVISDFTSGDHGISATYVGDENFAASSSWSINQEVDKVTTATAIQSSANPSVYGQPVTFTAQVSMVPPTGGVPAGTVPTGTVEFYDGTSCLGSAMLDGSDTASLQVSGLAFSGQDDITATYCGDQIFAGSSASIQQLLKPATITTITSSAPVSSVYGQPVTLTADVNVASPNTGVPTEAVEFLDGATILGAGTLDGSGYASFTTSSLTGGTHSITAVYAGDTTYAGSTSDVFHQVVDRLTPMNVAIGSSNNPSAYGDPITLSVSVSVPASMVHQGMLAPTETVDLTDESTGTDYGSVLLNGSGNASWQISNLVVGSHNFVAVYSGDTNYCGTQSSAMCQTVETAPTTIIDGSSQNPSMFGQLITLTATVAAENQGIGTPPGTVDFFDSTTNTDLGSASVVAGSASLPTLNLAVGGNWITVTYGGGGNFAGGSSWEFYQFVDGPSPGIILTSSPTSSSYGQTVTLTASIVDPVPGMNLGVCPDPGTPTGTVEFFDGGSELGSASLDCMGNASWQTSGLTVGDHGITAEYMGDTNYASITSPILNEGVDRAAPTVTISPSANPTTYGQQMTITALVSAGNWNLSMPTGTVEFYDGTTTLGSASLDGSGSASLATSALEGGGHSITAEYLGDGNYTSATSSAMNEEVGGAVSTVTISSSANPSTYGQPITLTVNVGSSAGTPSGSVDFYDSTTGTGQGAYLGSISLNAGTATLPISTLTTGWHSIWAAYDGDTNFTASSGSTSQTVQMAATTTVASSAPNPSSYGQSVTLTASVSAVSPGTGTPTGTVDFYNGGTDLGSASLDGSGTATLTTSTLGIDWNYLTATYDGSVNFTGSSGPVSQLVQPATTTTIASSSPNPSTYGQSITLTATVSAAGQGTSQPTGTVEFYDGGTDLGPAALDGWGNASLTTSSLGVGWNNISASYGGDDNFTGSSNSTASVDVQMATTTTITSSSPDPSVYGEIVTLTAQIGVVSPGGGTPTGTVQFCDECGYLGSATLNAANSASLAIPNFAVGEHSIWAAYGGDVNFEASTSASIDQEVSTAATATTLSSSPNPSISGEPVTLSAQVSAVSPGNGVPTGTVDFFDTTTDTDLGCAWLDSSATANLSTSLLAVGEQNIIASYNGDADFGGSPSPPITQVVEPALYWDPDGSQGLGGTGVWDAQTANWSQCPSGGNLQTWVDGSAAIFSGTAGTVTLSGSQSPVAMEFGTDGYVMTGGTITLAAADTTFNTVTGRATISSTIAGSGSLDKIGAGQLVLDGASAYAGGTTIHGGTLQIGDSTSNNTSFSGDITNNATLVLDAAGTDPLSIGGAIGGGGTVTKIGSGTLVLSSPTSDYTGGTVINAGTVQLGSASALGSASGALTINGGTLDLEGNGIVVGSLSGSGGNLTDDGAASGTTIVNVNQATDTTFSGTIQDGSARTLALAMTGTGTLTLSGTIAYSGGTSVPNGILDLETAASGAVVVSGGQVIGPGSPMQTLGIADVDVMDGAPSTNVDLSSQFTDTQDVAADLVFSIQGNSNPDLFASLSIDPASGVLTLAYAVSTAGYSNLTIRATDTNGLFTETSFRVTVHPMVSITGTPSSAAEGTPITLGADIYDPGEEGTFTYAWSVTQDGASCASGTASGFTFTPEQAGEYQVSLTVTDGNCTSSTGTTLVEVQEVPPVLTLAGDQTIAEGAPLDLTGLVSFTYAGTLDTHTATIDWGDGTPETQGTVTEANGAGTIDGSHVYIGGGVHTVTVTVADETGGSDTESFQVTIPNQAPTVALSAEFGSAIQGSPYSVTITATDPGQDLSNWVIQWGDGTSDTGYGAPPCQLTHVFDTEPQGQIVASVWDASGDCGEANMDVPQFRGRVQSSVTMVYWDSDCNASGDNTGTGAGLGGTGTWNTSTAEWYNPSTKMDVVWNSAYCAVFYGTAGTVTIDNGVTITAAQIAFQSNEYAIEGGRLGLSSLSTTGTSIQVDGTSNLDWIGSTIADPTTQIPGVLSIVANNIVSSGRLKDSGTLVLDGANTYSGRTVMAPNCGTVKLGAATTTAGGALGAGALTLDGGTLNLNGYDLPVADLSSDSGDGAGVVTSIAACTLTVGGNNNTDTYSGSIQGAVGLTVKPGSSGPHILCLRGANRYSGPTAIQAGSGAGYAELEAGAKSSNGAGLSQNSAVTVGSASYLNLGGYDSTIASLSGNGFVENSLPTSAPPKATLTVGGGIFSGVIEDGGARSPLALAVGAGTLTLTGANTYTGGTTINGGTLQLGDGSNNGSVLGDIKDGGTLIFAIAGTTSLQTFGGLISGSGSLTKSGSGTLTLTAAKTYNGSGGTTILGGTLQLGDGTKNGSVVGNISDNASLAFDNLTPQAFGGVISGGGSLSKSGAGTLTLTAANTYNGSGGTTINSGTLQLGDGTKNGSVVGNITDNATLAFDNPAAQTFAGVIGSTGTGGLAKFGAGVVTLTRVNAYGGATTISGGTLQVGVGNALPTKTALPLSSTAKLALNGFSQQLGSLSGGGSGMLGSGSLTVSGGSSTTYSGVISGTGGLTKAGSGMLTLAGPNTYSGGTVLNGGTLQVGSASALGAASGALVTNGGTLDLGGKSITIGSLNGTGGTITNNVATATTTLTVNGGGTYSGAIQNGAVHLGTGPIVLVGPVALTKEGTAMLTLSGTLNYSGQTTVKAGTLNLAPVSINPYSPIQPTIYEGAKAVGPGLVEIWDSALYQQVRHYYSDGGYAINRHGMISILQYVDAQIPASPGSLLSETDFGDLQTIVASPYQLQMTGYMDASDPGYVDVLASDVVVGNPANAHYHDYDPVSRTTTIIPLGNLWAGDPAWKLNDLVNKWFVGTDHPDPACPYDNLYSTNPCLGSLFKPTPNGPIAGPPLYTDAKQSGQLGDCFLISGLCSIARVDPTAIENMFIDNRDGTYTVRFYYQDQDSGLYTADYVTVDCYLPVDAVSDPSPSTPNPAPTQEELIYSDVGQNAYDSNNVLWIALAEKAYAQWNETTRDAQGWPSLVGINSYESIAQGGDPGFIASQAVGSPLTCCIVGAVSSPGVIDKQDLINDLPSDAIIFSTNGGGDGLNPSHAFDVVGYDSVSDSVELYNPYGFAQSVPWDYLLSHPSMGIFEIVNPSAPPSAASSPGVRTGGSSTTVRSGAEMGRKGLAASKTGVFGDAVAARPGPGPASADSLALSAWPASLGNDGQQAAFGGAGFSPTPPPGPTPALVDAVFESATGRRQEPYSVSDQPQGSSLQIAMAGMQFPTACLRP